MAAEIKIVITEQSSGGGIAAAKRDLNDLSNTAKNSGGGFNALREVATGALRAVGQMATQAFLEAGRAAVGFLKDSVTLAGDFEAGMLAFGAAAGQGFEQGTEKLDQFHDLFLDLGKKLPVSTSEVQQAAIALVRGGLDPAAIAAGGLESSLNFAAAAGMGLEKAAELTIKQLGTFVPVGASVEEQTRFMAESQNLLVKAANASTLNVDKLGDAMLQAGGQAGAAGLQYEDFVTTMGLISPAFGSAAEAGTSFKNFLVRLQPSTDKATEMMIALGLATEDGQSKFYDAQGQFVGMRDASEMLQNAIGGLTDAERVQALQTIFGNDAMGAANALVNGGAEAYDIFAQKMEQANGVSEQAAAVQQGFNFVMENIKGTIEAVQIQIGEFLLPYLTSLVVTANNLINAITGDQAAFAALSPTLQAIILTTEQLWADFQAGVAFVQGIMAAFQNASTQSGFFSQALTDLTGIWQHVQQVIAVVAPAIQAVVTAVFGQIQAFLNAHGEEIQTFIQTTWNTIVQIIHIALELIKTILVPILLEIATFINTHGTEIQTILSAVWSNIQTIIGGALSLIQGIVTTALQLLQGDFSGAWNTIKQTSATFVLNLQTIFTNAWTIIKTIFGTAFTNLINNARLGLNAIWAAIVTFFTNATSHYTTGLETIRLLWDTMWATLKATFQATLDSIVGWVLQTLQGIANAITSFKDGIASAAASVGGGIVSGIIDGIRSGVDSIISAARDAAQSALDAAMDALGVGSPSRVFAERVGLPIAQGLAQGMVSGTPLVARAAEQTAGAAVSGATNNNQRYSTLTYAPVYNNTASVDPSMDAAFARSLSGSF